MHRLTLCFGNHRLISYIHNMKKIILTDKGTKFLEETHNLLFPNDEEAFVDYDSIDYDLRVIMDMDLYVEEAYCENEFLDINDFINKLVDDFGEYQLRSVAEVEVPKKLNRALELELIEIIEK